MPPYPHPGGPHHALCDGVDHYHCGYWHSPEASAENLVGTTTITGGNPSRQGTGRGPPVAEQQHGNTYNFFINITFNVLGPVRELLCNGDRAHNDRGIGYTARRAIEPSRRWGGSSMTDSRITRRIESLPNSSRHSNTRQDTGGRSRSSRYPRSEPATMSKRGSSSKQEPLTSTALWAHEQSSRNKKGSGRTSYAEGRSRRAPIEMETVRSEKTILSRAKNLAMPPRSENTARTQMSKAGKSKHSSRLGNLLSNVSRR
ncbi:hypothetical protein LTR85_005717 [Meristemomyces frigidus]|nr:hypothetical protein LTR85_005717 [Meristemomyces frigidus]